MKLIVRLLAGLLVTVSAAGCQTLNRYSPNVISYNLEAEKAADTAIVLNVVRASKRRPLIFMDLQTVTGATPASGTLGFSIPLAENKGTTATTMSPSLALSGGPTAASAVINTQEFYQGILKPIPTSTIDLLVQRGISRDLLFNLLISNIIISRQSDPAKAIEFRNYPGDSTDLAAFQRVMEALVDEGLTTSVGKGEAADFGPPLTPQEIVGTDIVSRSAAAGLKVSQTAFCDLDQDEREDLRRRSTTPIDDGVWEGLNRDCDALDGKVAGASGQKTIVEVGAEDRKALEEKVRNALLKASWPLSFYEIEKADSGPHANLCFGATRLEGNDAIVPTCRSKPVKQGPELQVLRLPYSRRLCLELKGRRLIDPKDGVDPCAKTDWDQDLQISLVPRSTYGVIYYLGEVVRRAGPRADASTGVNIRFPAESGTTCTAPRPGVPDDPAEAPRPPSCRPIFKLTAGDRRSNSLVHVSYDGEPYAVSNDYESQVTYEVLDLVTELLALNRSAKDLPTSSVVTLVGAP